MGLYYLGHKEEYSLALTVTHLCHQSRLLSPFDIWPVINGFIIGEA